MGRLVYEALHETPYLKAAIMRIALAAFRQLTGYWFLPVPEPGTLPNTLMKNCSLFLHLGRAFDALMTSGCCRQTAEERGPSGVSASRPAATCVGKPLQNYPEYYDSAKVYSRLPSSCIQFLECHAIRNVLQQDTSP